MDDYVIIGAFGEKLKKVLDTGCDFVTMWAMNKYLYMQTTDEISQRSARMPDALWKFLRLKLLSSGDGSFQDFVNRAALKYIGEPAYEEALLDEAERCEADNLNEQGARLSHKRQDVPKEAEDNG
jgi:hypothetical protein